MPGGQRLAGEGQLPTASFGVVFGAVVVAAVRVFARLDGEVVLAHFIDGGGGVEAVFKPGALDAQFVGRAFFRVKRVVVDVFVVLRAEDGAVAGVGGEVLVEVVGEAEVGGQHAVFFAHARDVVVAEVVAGAFPVGQARAREQRPVVAEVDAGRAVERAGLFFVGAVAELFVFRARHVTVADEAVEVGDVAFADVGVVFGVFAVAVGVVAHAKLHFVLAAKERVFAVEVQVEAVFFRVELFFEGDERGAAVGVDGGCAAHAVVVVGFAEAVAVGGAQSPVVVEVVLQAGEDFVFAAFAV